MSLTQDSRKVWEPWTPPCSPTILRHADRTGYTGTPEEPSITNVKNYHKTYYVPTTWPSAYRVISIPTKWSPRSKNTSANMQPEPQPAEARTFEPEQPDHAPVVKGSIRLEAANVMLGWRLPGATDPSTDVANIVARYFITARPD